MTEFRSPWNAQTEISWEMKLGNVDPVFHFVLLEMWNNSTVVQLIGFDYISVKSKICFPLFHVNLLNRSFFCSMTR